MQRTTVLRAADGSLENTFQPASHCMTANESAAGKVSSAPEKSRNHCALMWTCPAAKYSQILRCLITRRLRCYLLLSVCTRLKSHMMTGEHFTPNVMMMKKKLFIMLMLWVKGCVLHCIHTKYIQPKNEDVNDDNTFLCVYFLCASGPVWLRKAVCGILDPQKYQWGMQDHAVQPCCNGVCVCVHVHVRECKAFVWVQLCAFFFIRNRWVSLSIPGLPLGSSQSTNQAPTHTHTHKESMHTHALIYIHIMHSVCLRQWEANKPLRRN